MSYAVASESMTLLKNKNNTLPFAKTDKIFVCGPAANSLNLLNGAWTHTWQGVDTAYNNPGKLTILQALRQNFGKNNVFYAKGSNLDSLIDVKNCIKQAKKADKIVICLGEKPCTEGVGNIDNLDLPLAQRTLVLELSKLNKPIVLVCNFNRPRIIHDIVPKVDAILYAYLSGDEGGRAIADCLDGTVNPSGKLPFTYPKAANDLVHYDHKTTEEADVDFSMNAYRPEFDFGYGLSYSSFSYSPMTLSKDVLLDGSKIEISVTITNNSSQKGSEVVQLYYKDLVASITPCAKKLTGFEKISLNAGESKTVKFIVNKNDFSFIDKNLNRITEAGEIELQIGKDRKVITVK